MIIIKKLATFRINGFIMRSSIPSYCTVSVRDTGRSKSKVKDLSVSEMSVRTFHVYTFVKVLTETVQCVI